MRDTTLPVMGGVSTKVKRMMGMKLSGVPDFDHFYRKQSTLCIESMEIRNRGAANRQI